MKDSDRQGCGYVMLPEVMEKYQGAIDASAHLRRRQQGLQENIDSLIRQVNVGDPNRLSERQDEIRRYVQASEQRHEENKVAIGKEVLSTVRNATERVAKSQGIDIVLAVTDEDFILHGGPGTDVTEMVLEELKQSYRNEFRRP
jgi:Skp family chaperone for outer membrane proteins